MHSFERFSEDARQTLRLAQREAERARHNYIGTEHLLLGLVEGETGARRVLAELGVDRQMVRESVKNVFGRNEPTLIEPVVPTSRVKKVIELAFDAAMAERSAFVASEHILLALMEEKGGLGGRVLQDLGVTVDRVQLQRGSPGQHPWPRPGERVLVHDPEPPYRLWEGTASGREGGLVKVSVPGHPDRPEATVPVEELHSIPLRLYPRCKRCSFRI